MPRKSITEVKSRFIGQIADAERAVEKATTERDRTVAAAHAKLEEAKTAFELTCTNARRDVEMAEAHLSGMRAALALFEDPKKAGEGTAKS